MTKVEVLLLTACSKAKAMLQDLAAAIQKIVSEAKEQDNSVFDEIQQRQEGQPWLFEF
jgi:hypothetical protein